MNLVNRWMQAWTWTVLKSLNVISLYHESTLSWYSCLINIFRLKISELLFHDKYYYKFIRFNVRILYDQTSDYLSHATFIIWPWLMAYRYLFLYLSQFEKASIRYPGAKMSQPRCQKLKYFFEMSAAFEFLSFQFQFWLYCLATILTQHYETVHNAALNQTSNIVIFVLLPQFFWQRLLAHFCSRVPNY